MTGSSRCTTRACTELVTLCPALCAALSRVLSCRHFEGTYKMHGLTAGCTGRQQQAAHEHPACPAGLSSRLGLHTAQTSCSLPITYIKCAGMQAGGSVPHL